MNAGKVALKSAEHAKYLMKMDDEVSYNVTEAIVRRARTPSGEVALGPRRGLKIARNLNADQVRLRGRSTDSPQPLVDMPRTCQ